MTTPLRLYNTFQRVSKIVELQGQTIAYPANYPPQHASFYICGPTVYSDCHVGHALTYIRADLFRRFMKSIFNVRLHTVMNITDIDDKIIARANAEYVQPDSFKEPSNHPFNRISDRYYASFIADMERINCQPADMHIKVSKSVHMVIKFIQELERRGHAYISPDNDVNFKVNSVPNYIGRRDPRQTIISEEDARDFALWKAAKPNEPEWVYQSTSTGRQIRGRPGWHVQCSAISSAIFGDTLDFHYGGKDLIFPHHYNEEACSCAFHELDTSQSLNVWVSHWLHSGHLVLNREKMSKSLGNVVTISNFVDRASINALRLLCIISHYRSDINYDDDMFEKVKEVDHKVSAFLSYLFTSSRAVEENIEVYDSSEMESESRGGYISEAVAHTHSKIIEGICDDFHLDRGLDAILELAKIFYARGQTNLLASDIISASSLINDWCKICGLNYAATDRATEQALANLLLTIRQNVRQLSLEQIDRLKQEEKADPSTRPENAEFKKHLQKLMKVCDNARSEMMKFGLVARDPKFGT